MSQFARFACWSEGKCAATIKAIALATKKGSTAMSVEYVATASDGKGRLYARQIGAQSLPRNLRLLMYGSTHKEVDMSGAHYELTRALCASKTLPAISVLRDWLRHLWAPRLACDDNGDVGKAVKLFPVRIINGGAASALRHLDLLGLDTPTWIYAFAYDLEAARSITTSHLLTVIRPRLEVAFHNQHFLPWKQLKVLLCNFFC